MYFGSQVAVSQRFGARTKALELHPARDTMTSAMVAPIEQAPRESKVAASGPPPRKRRRRTAGGGATDDCFTCRSRAVKCDRKRPYCTQCIEIGKECSGYKTTLTWGVGVASRGKLRGLSCPIANKNVDGSDVSPTEMEARRRKSSTSNIKKEDTANNSLHGLHTGVTIPGSVSIPAQSHAQTYPPPALPLSLAHLQDGWQVPGFHDHVQSRPANGGRGASLSHPSLHHLQTAMAPQYDGVSVPNSGRSVGSYPETEFHSPLEYPHTPVSLPFSEQLPQSMATSYPDQSLAGNSTDSLGMNNASADSYPNNVNSGLSSVQSNGNLNHTHVELNPFGDNLFNRSDNILGSMNDTQLSFSPFDTSNLQVDDEDVNDRKDLALVDTRFSSPFFHLSPRMQTLMDYYDRNICPFLVAFDGTENPYRKHILQLAMNNEGLQNAIAALSTNNIRMRRKEPGQIGIVEEITDAFDGSSFKNVNDPTPEESCYKQMSIDQLNMQLIDAHAAQDDSVLATLLILCLFHVCDTGFSKFKTQLAGVQKLLSLRNPSVQSDFTGWVEMFFTWFDVMTSTVNDREMQIKRESMAMLDFSTNLGALEQFSGCDGRLFKLIARLGRLNLLAQGRPVKTQSGELLTPRPTFQRPTSRALKRKRGIPKPRANRSLSVADYENIDGNGWGTPIISSDEDADGSADEGLITLDERAEFWTEWHDIRSRLQSLQMDFTYMPPAAPNGNFPDPADFDAGQRDLVHINESFRYSALLYTERLGYPVLPSSHNQFQELVSRALYHIEALSVTSCVNKFLLWPLFIIGTECVDEGHRNVIRHRCREVANESGFFNNISSLDLLEKVWREVGSNVRGSEAEEVQARRRDSEAGRSGRYGQAFRWRKAMDRVDGEYIVI